ncbi:retropepsin-like aspartic protease family protein [Gayadomonas joobiniege]|uniref:retropepsin-like aspartic protease family protein n=1 Tax=Gayadomonas joobiniege TaxID=1234606 RepID=UPI00058D34D8|nr:retropepsin-like aspartic protease [Gayadomonas joobiniege]
MFYAAWITALILLSLFFNNYLSKKNNPNQNPNSELSANGSVTVELKRNPYGHYVTSGLINRQPVVFMLDTGATQVSIPEPVAQKLGLTYGREQWVNTANGRISVYQTQLDTLSIGRIQLHQVSANINPFMQGEQILLGMSVLKRLDFSQRGDILTLQQ